MQINDFKFRSNRKYKKTYTFGIEKPILEPTETISVEVTFNVEFNTNVPNEKELYDSLIEICKTLIDNKKEE
jgi:hypothetical protein